MSTIAAPLRVSPASAPRPRLAGLDRLRGAAVVLMVLDHALIVFGYPTHELRFTVTRAAMPLFFVLSGHLFARLRRRHLGILAVGLFLPVLVPWVDSPNVLVLYVLGCVVLALAAHRPLVLLVLVAVPLTAYANGFAWGDAGPTAYNPLALVALMALGQLVPRQAVPLSVLSGRRVPAFLEVVGRFPLSVYVGHLLALEAVRRVAA